MIGAPQTRTCYSVIEARLYHTDIPAHASRSLVTHRIASSALVVSRKRSASADANVSFGDAPKPCITHVFVYQGRPCSTVSVLLGRNRLLDQVEGAQIMFVRKDSLSKGDR